MSLQKTMKSVILNVVKNITKTYHVYILTTKLNKMLYVGVTNNLEKRIFEHRSKLTEGYTKKYNINKLVYFESFTDIKDAIAAEKKIKGWTRIKKNQLIESINPYWQELYPSLHSG